MDHYSILETPSVSAGIAAANALRNPAAELAPRFPGQDSGHSLAEMAQADLDAALQLLADRAQYITGASGAAIALRRGTHKDMVCRASVGENAPELGSLLSMEYGLSGESVRTRQLLRCDDAERDPRVNRDACRELGIASVVVMPIVSAEQVLGVFELFSGTPCAFGERDLSALLRLGEMVETAVKHAAAAPIAPPVPEIAVAKSQPQVAATLPTPPPAEPPARPISAAPAPPKSQPVPTVKQAEPAPQKPQFWSAAVRTQTATPALETAEVIAVPMVLRKLHQCEACGFPVSQGRTFCVECEEKQWRGQRSHPPAAAPALDQPTSRTVQNVSPVLQGTFVRDSASSQAPIAPVALVAPVPAASQEISAEAAFAIPTGLPASDQAAPFLSSALPTESWFSANKYILASLLLVAAVCGVIAWFR